MIFVYIGAFLVIIGMFVFIMSEISLKRKKEAVINILKKHGSLKESNNSSFDYYYMIDNEKYQLKLIHIGNHKELSINSKKHWQVKPANKLKMIPTNGFDGLEEPKILFVYPEPVKMIKYVNENEIVFIKPNEKCFDFYVFTEKSIKYINL